MLGYNELKPGIIFIKDEHPYKVLTYQFVRKQQRKPVTQLKLKNLATGKVQEYTAHQNEKFEEVEMEEMTAVFIYKNRGEYWFHESGKPGERFNITEETLGNAGDYLKENTEVKTYKFKGTIINIEPPIKVKLKVAEAPPAVKGNTAQGGTKQVVLETGLKTNVPLFIEKDDVILINTETGEYAERVEKGE